MEGQRSLRKQVKLRQRIMCSGCSILQPPMPNEHPGWKIWFLMQLSMFVFSLFSSCGM